MARIVGVDIPNEKRVVIALTYIFGIGLSTAEKILKDAEVSEDIRVKNLTDEQLLAIRNQVANTNSKAIYVVKSPSTSNGSRKSDAIAASAPQGPARPGQRTRTNARTRKGPRKTIANKKMATQG
jgi:small subunit ribosomal protein S13